MKKIFTKKQIKKIKETILTGLVFILIFDVPVLAVMAHWLYVN